MQSVTLSFNLITIYNSKHHVSLYVNLNDFYFANKIEKIAGTKWVIIFTGGGMWVSHYIFVACLNYSAERQVLRVRKEFFRAVLRQDLAWYDTATTAEFATRMTEDLNKLQVEFCCGCVRVIASCSLRGFWCGRERSFIAYLISVA